MVKRRDGRWLGGGVRGGWEKVVATDVQCFPIDSISDFISMIYR